jgi:hypothetical protein
MTRAQPKTPAPDDLDVDQRKRLLSWARGRAYPVTRPPDQFYLQLVNSRKLLRCHVDNCLEWHREKEISRSSWVAACQKWIGKAALEFEQRRVTEKPKMQQARGKDFSPLSDVIRDIETKEMFEGDK